MSAEGEQGAESYEELPEGFWRTCSNFQALPDIEKELVKGQDELLAKLWQLQPSEGMKFFQMVQASDEAWAAGLKQTHNRVIQAAGSLFVAAALQLTLVGVVLTGDFWTAIPPLSKLLLAVPICVVILDGVVASTLLASCINTFRLISRSMTPEELGDFAETRQFVRIRQAERKSCIYRCLREVGDMEGRLRDAGGWVKYGFYAVGGTLFGGVLARWLV